MGAALADAVAALRRGELVVYPTDTLLGLAALATDRRAVRKLASVKGRPAAQPVSFCVSSTEEVEPYADVSMPARRFVRRHLPGAYTLLLSPSPSARRSLSPGVVAHGRVGIRVPDHPVARELARRVGPITATSANRHGAPPARSLAEARRAFGDEVRVYLAAGPRGSGTPSTLIDLVGPEPRTVARR